VLGSQVLQKFFLRLLRYPITHFDLIKNKKLTIDDSSEVTEVSDDPCNDSG